MTEKCPDCQGNGTRYDYNTRSEYLCETCDGKGELELCPSCRHGKEINGVQNCPWLAMCPDGLEYQEVMR